MYVVRKPASTVARPFGDEPSSGNGPALTDAGELATTMLMRGAFGVLLGAAVAPRGREGIWGSAGFVVGTVLGQPGILAMAMAALYQKASSKG